MQAFLQLLLPLMRVAAHPALRDSVHTHLSNTFYHRILTKLRLEQLAPALDQLRSTGWPNAAGIQVCLMPTAAC